MLPFRKLLNALLTFVLKVRMTLFRIEDGVLNTHSGGGLMPSGYLRVAALVLIAYNVVDRFASASLVARRWVTA
jgi:hypothetical protein